MLSQKKYLKISHKSAPIKLIDINYVNERDKELVAEFINSTTSKKYILGINKFTKSVQKFVQVDGVIDDFTRVQRSRKKEILKIIDVPKDGLILYVSTGSPLEVKARLKELGFNCISYLSFFKYASFSLLSPPFMEDFYDDFTHNYARYQRSYDLLCDKESQEIFQKVINFKISLDDSFMEGFTNNHDKQYFDKEILPKIKHINFFDGGAYVGDTTTQLIKNYPDYNKIWLVEPIQESMRIAKRELSGYENIELLVCGVGEREEMLSMHEEKSFSTVYGNGVESVKIRTIDNIVQDEKVDFIKLDVEGAEFSALKGAQKTIQKYKPILAICIYHRARDWYLISEFILSLEKGYKIYLRHYMEGIFESVLYFIPTSEEELV